MSRFSWQTAKTYYLSNEQISYEDVSRKFGMSIGAIKQYQKRMKESWVAMRRETIQKVAINLPTKLGENLAAVQARQARIGRSIQTKAVLALERGDIAIHSAREARAFIISGVAIERKALNMDSMSFH